MHDVDGRLGLKGEGHRPGRRHGLDVWRPRRGVEPGRGVAAGEGVGDGRVEQDGVLAVDLEHPTASAHDPHRLEQLAVAEPEVEHHERLGGRDPGIDAGGQLGERVVGPSADDER